MSLAWIVLQVADGAAAKPSAGPLGFLVSLFPFILVFVIMYFFLIRPQAKKAKEQQKMLDSITPGTEIVTGAGIHGVVKGVKGQNNEILIIQIAENVKIDIDRGAVGRVKSMEGK